MQGLEIVRQCLAFEDDAYGLWYVEGFLQSLLPFAHLVEQHRVSLWRRAEVIQLCAPAVRSLLEVFPAATP